MNLIAALKPILVSGVAAAMRYLTMGKDSEKPPQDGRLEYRRSSFWNFDVGTLISLVTILAAGLYWKADVDNKVVALADAKTVQAQETAKLAEKVVILDRDGTASGNAKLGAITTHVTALNAQLSAAVGVVDRKYDGLDVRIRPVENAIIQLQSVPQDMRDVKAKLTEIAVAQAALTARLRPSNDD